MKKKQLNPVVLGVGIFILFGVLIISTTDFSKLAQNNQQAATSETVVQAMPKEDREKAIEAMRNEVQNQASEDFQVPQQSVVLIPRGDATPPKPSETNIGSHWYNSDSDAAVQTQKGGS
ncbi:MAG: hypothetical protein KF812_04860 [Fimbriimonadaceae bacterium]|nr:hypothetical protein [Fimbriimonadaceae bacterium]